MRTSVKFRTRLFDSKEPKPHLINPRCFGEDLGAWLISRLKLKLSNPAFSFGELIREDWGWEFQAKTIGVSVLSDDRDQDCGSHPFGMGSDQ